MAGSNPNSIISRYVLVTLNVKQNMYEYVYVVYIYREKGGIFLFSEKIKILFLCTFG